MAPPLLGAGGPTKPPRSSGAAGGAPSNGTPADRERKRGGGFKGGACAFKRRRGLKREGGVAYLEEAAQRPLLELFILQAGAH